MVQYIITPWRDRQELFMVRKAFFPLSDDDENREMDQRRAVSLISVWVQRGNCPHLIESTALLISAKINDEAGSSVYAVRAAYSAAFCRFVTGLLDGYQDRRHKLSMYSIAKNIGLPATFVELRHQCTHEELPSLARLRAAAEKAIAWIFECYWKTINDPEASSGPEECRAFLQEYLRWRSRGNDDKAQGNDFEARLKAWDTSLIMDVLSEFGGSDAADAGFILQAVKLSRDLIEEKTDHEGELDVSAEKLRSIDEIKIEMAKAREALKKADNSLSTEAFLENVIEDHDMAEDNTKEKPRGWAMWDGPWTPKPIGVV